MEETKQTETNKEKFLNHFKLTEKDFTHLWSLFLEYGMTRGEAKHRSKANHYYLQGIGQYLSVGWKTWNKNLTPELKEIIVEKYPQLMVQNKQFEI